MYSRGFVKKITEKETVCLKGLERYQGEYLMTSFSYSGELTL